MFERLLITAGLVLLGVCAFALFRHGHLRRASKAARASRGPCASRGAIAVGKPAVLYFRSDACAPCATQSRFLQQLQAEFGDRIVVERVDAELEQEKAERFGIFTLPTTLIVDPRGQVRHANYGLADTRKLATQVRAVEASPAL